MRNKQFLYDYLFSHPCVWEGCKVSDPDMLEFDHLKDKIKPVTVLANERVSLETLKAEIAKCQVLCANHHRKKTYQQFGRRKWTNRTEML